jgi:hypothetical protein
MADSWELARGLNPAVATDRNLVVTAAESPSLAGYTWLEMYLNDLTLQANWAGPAIGFWDTIPNWNGQVPRLQDSTANLPNIGTASVINLQSDEHIGQLNFDNPLGYTLVGGGDVTMDVLSHGGVGFATVTVFSGSHTIGVPLNLASDTHFSVASNSALSVIGALSASGRAITKDGGGTLQFENVRAASLNVNGGTLKISAKGSPNSVAGASVVNALSIPSGTLDLTDNSLVINYTTLGTLLADTRQALQDGRLTTSLSADGHALGYADNGSGSLTVAYTFAGDANLDGRVNAVDFNVLASNFSTGAKFWSQADFNYDGSVNTLDFNALARNFGQSLAIPLAPLGGQVPEPASASPMLGLGLLFRIHRGRKSQRGAYRA